MQGRWTIWVCPVCGHAGGTDVCAGPRDHHELISRPEVPVVPCDDAAIERVARRKAERDGFWDDGTGWDRLTEADRELLREEARDDLRAAGETP